MDERQLEHLRDLYTPERYKHIVFRNFIMMLLIGSDATALDYAIDYAKFMGWEVNRKRPSKKIQKVANELKRGLQELAELYD